MKTSLKAKNFCWFWGAVAALVLVLAVWMIYRFIRVAGLPEMPEGDLDAMLYLLMSERKAWISGIGQTMAASVAGTGIGFAFAVVLAYIRQNEPTLRDPRPVQYVKYIMLTLEKLYVTIIRGTPMMVQACIIYYGGFSIVKALMPGASVTQVNQVWSLFASALITVILNSAAYLAEVLRGGIDSVEQGQKEAAFSLGFTPWQSITRVVYPQAIRNSLPSIVNELINNIKGTSVLTVIGFGELMFATTSIAGKTYRYLPTYLVAAVLYLALVVLLSYGLNKLVDCALHRRNPRKGDKANG